MVVAINAPRAPEQEQKKERMSDMDKLFMALRIAETGLGAAVNYDTFMNSDEVREAKLAESAAKVKESEAGTALKEKQAGAQKTPDQVKAESEAQVALDKAKALAQGAKAKEAEAKAAATGPGMTGLPPAAQDLFKKIPEKHRKDALKEMGYREDLEVGMKNIGGAYDTFAATGALMGSMPFTESKAKVDAASSQVMASLQANWKGPMSDTDLKRIGGVMPDITDTKAQTLAKKAEMLKLLETNSKKTPTLDLFGAEDLGKAAEGTELDLSGIPKDQHKGLQEKLKAFPADQHQKIIDRTRALMKGGG